MIGERYTTRMGSEKESFLSQKYVELRERSEDLVMECKEKEPTDMKLVAGAIRRLARADYLRREPTKVYDWGNEIEEIQNTHDIDPAIALTIYDDARCVGEINAANRVKTILERERRQKRTSYPLLHALIKNFAQRGDDASSVIDAWSVDSYDKDSLRLAYYENSPEESEEAVAYRQLVTDKFLDEAYDPYATLGIVERLYAAHDSPDAKQKIIKKVQQVSPSIDTTMETVEALSQFTKIILTDRRRVSLIDKESFQRNIAYRTGQLKGMGITPFEIKRLTEGAAIALGYYAGKRGQTFRSEIDSMYKIYLDETPILRRRVTSHDTRTPEDIREDWDTTLANWAKTIVSNNGDYYTAGELLRGISDEKILSTTILSLADTATAENIHSLLPNERERFERQEVVDIAVARANTIVAEKTFQLQMKERTEVKRTLKSDMSALRRRLHWREPKDQIEVLCALERGRVQVESGDRSGFEKMYRVVDMVGDPLERLDWMSLLVELSAKEYIWGDSFLTHKKQRD